MMTNDIVDAEILRLLELPEYSFTSTKQKEGFMEGFITGAKFAKSKLESELTRIREENERLKDTISNLEDVANMAAVNYQKALKEIERLRGRHCQAINALKKAKKFITNGFEYGYIKMPDEGSGDTALLTLPLIVEVLNAEHGRES